MANPSMTTNIELNTINSLTLPLISKKIADNITGKIPLFYFLNKIGHKEYEGGGTEYRLPVFKELATAQAYTGTTTLTNQEKDLVSSAVYQRKQISLDITLSGTKLLANSGNDPTAVVNYIAAQIEMAEESMKSSLAGTSIGVMSSQSDSGLGITGLKTFITDSTSTGTVGGLSRATYSWWNHNSESVTTGFSTDGLNHMTVLLLKCNRGEESPTVIVMTETGYGLLLAKLTASFSFNVPTTPATKFGDIGFEHINFYGTPVIFDAGMTSSRAFFLNLKYLKLLVHRDRDMAIRDFITPSNEDSITDRLYWAGNLVCNNLARQGICQGNLDTDA